jgi:polyhydroxybutyrate depolymerase
MGTSFSARRQAAWLGLAAVLSCGGNSQDATADEGAGGAGGGVQPGGVGGTDGVPGGTVKTGADSGTVATTTDGGGQANGSPGCGKPIPPAPADGGVEQNGTYYPESTITVQGTTYNYAMFVPKTYDPNKPTNLLIDFHGANWQGDWDRGGFQWNMEYSFKAVFIYPTAQGVPNARWNSSGAGSRDVLLFDALSDMAFNTFCIDQKRVFVIGFSSGGFMTNSLACVRGDKIRGAAPESGCGPSGSCTGPVAWIGTHGNQDSTVAPTSGEGSRDFFIKENGCDETPVPYDPQPKPGGSSDAQPDCVHYQGCKTGFPVDFCTGDYGHAYQIWTHTVAGAFFDALQ